MAKKKEEMQVLVEAARAYNSAVTKIFGKFAVQNKL